jgi:hypothetical protein
MNDWRSKVQMSRHDGLKAAGVILGLMVACIFAVWLLARLFRHDVPAQRQPVPAAPTAPKPAKLANPTTP